MEVDAQQPDNPSLLTDHWNCNRLQGLSAFVVEIGLYLQAASAVQILQHSQSQIGDGSAFTPLGVVTVDDLDNRMVQILQTVQNDLVTLAQIGG